MRRQESLLRARVLAVRRPPPLAAVQAPLPGLPVSWEPQDPEGGKLLSADVAKMDWIYLDEGGGKGVETRVCRKERRLGL